MKKGIKCLAVLFSAVFLLTILIPAQLFATTVSATIYSYSPSSKIEVDPGQSFALSVTFTNTGNTAWDFLAGVSVWDSNGNLVIDEWSSTITVQAGQRGSYNWTKSIDTPGEYYLQFGVWKDKSTLLNKSPSPSQNLIKVRQPAAATTVSATIYSYSPSSKIEVDPGQSFTISVTFTNNGNTGAYFYAGASVWDSNGKEIFDDWGTKTYLSAGQQGSASWAHTIDTPGEYYLQFGVWDETKSQLLAKAPSPKQNLIKVIEGEALLENQPPVCNVKLQKDGVKIDEIDVGEFFKIYVGDSNDDTAIKEIRFSSDDEQNGNPTGEWTNWYNWNTSSGDWNASTKIKMWSFATGGNKEVWAEVKDGNGEIDQCHNNIFVPPPENQPPICKIDPGQAYVQSGTPISFDASRSYDPDPDGKIINYEWDFGDGTVLQGPQFQSAEHRFRGAMVDPNTLELKPRTYTVRLTVTDDRGTTATATASILVKPLHKPIEISPPAPTLRPRGFAKMTAYYNWVGVTEDTGEDVYVVSTIHFEAEGFVSYVLSIWDQYSLSIGVPAWSQGLVYFWQPVEKLFTFPFSTSRDWKYTFHGDGDFKGMAVGPLDKMRLWAFDVEEISGAIGPTWNGASTSFAPDSVAEPITDEAPPDLILAQLCSPAELRIYDSEWNVTGLVNGEVKEEIANSIYNDETKTVVILSPTDSYRYEVVGTDDGTYGLLAISVEKGETTRLSLANVTTSTGSVHEYTVHWGALSEGEKGITIEIDSDGDGTFERTILTTIPNTPSNPSPSGHAIGISINTDLRWTSSNPDADKMMTYEIYFGTDEIPSLKETTRPYSTTQTSIVYDPGPLRHNTTYYWKIRVINSDGITAEGPTWSFTTGSWLAGQSRTVRVLIYLLIPLALLVAAGLLVKFRNKNKNII